MKKQVIFLLALVSLIVFACQKELSFEGSNTPAKGSLKSDVSGDCLPKTVNGTYTAGVALVPATNSITVQVTITKTGTYTIGTDTVNGYYFRGTGTFTTLGVNTVTLRGNGTPFANGLNNFVVSFDGSICDIQVTVISAGVGTLAGSPNACAPITVSGGYSPGVALNSGNNAVVQVNVTVAGSINITTDTLAGIWFTFSGALPTGSNQNVTLQAQGAIPATTTPGPQTFTVKLGTSRCTFVVNVVAPAAYTINCPGVVVNGVYTQGVALTAANTITIPITVTTPGAYSIGPITIVGMTFSASGTLTAATTSITLTGTGTPTASGIQNLSVGTPACTIPINVLPAASNAVFTLDGNPGTCSNATVNGFYVASTVLDASNTVVINVTVITAGAVPALSTTPAVNGMTFSAPAGTLAAGAQTITLTGSGTPTTAGDFTIPFTAGGTTCSFKIHVLPNDYFPRTTLSNWSYEFDDNFDPTDTIIRYVKNVPPVSLGGNSYTIFMQDDGITGEDSSGYYRRNGGDYFEFLDIGNFIGYDDPLWNQYTMLKDNMPANTVWKSPTTGGYAGLVTGVPFNIRFSYKILQKDVPITVNTSLGSVNYKNVIVVEEKYEVEIAPGIWQDLTPTIDFYGKSYYARGIGLIKYESLDAANNVTFLMEMRRFYVY